VRIGKDGTYVNANSTELHHVTSQYNGTHGIYIHDGVAIGPADANAGTLTQCFAQYNGGDGIRLGHAFWVTVLNCLTELNSGYGLYLSGTSNNGYPECRYANIVGGDFNEGNTSGAVYDASYFSSFLNPDNAAIPTTEPTGLQGAGYRNTICPRLNNLQGLTVQTGTGTFPLVADAGNSGNNVFPLILQQTTTSSNTGGVGMQFKTQPSSGAYRVAGQIRVSQRTTNYDNMIFSVNSGGSVLDLFTISGYLSETSLSPSADNTTALGRSSARWSVVYSTTGAINTSDKNQKQQIQDLTLAELNVAKEIKKLIKSFKFNDAVESKGENARIHIGVIAQEVQKAFIDNELDANKYGIFCSDTWVDDEGVDQTRLGIRYEELLAFIIAAL